MRSFNHSHTLIPPCDEHTWSNKIGEVVESPPPKRDGDGDVYVLLWAAVIRESVAVRLSRDKLPLSIILNYNQSEQEITSQELARLINWLT